MKKELVKGLLLGTGVVIFYIFVFIVIMLYAQKSHGMGISLGYGQDVSVESWQSEGLKCSVVQIEISKEFKSPWYGSVVLDKMQGKVNPMTIDGKHFSGTYNGLVISTRVGIQKRLFDGLYGNFYGGFGVLPKHMPEIGNSGIVGHFGAGVKYVTTNWEIGYEWIHMSDPLQSGDKGWNIQFLTIGWRF